MGKLFGKVIGSFLAILTVIIVFVSIVSIDEENRALASESVVTFELDGKKMIQQGKEAYAIDQFLTGKNIKTVVIPGVHHRKDSDVFVTSFGISFSEKSAFMYLDVYRRGDQYLFFEKDKVSNVIVLSRDEMKEFRGLFCAGINGCSI